MKFFELQACLCNVIDPEEGVREEQRLDGSELEGRSHMAGAVECACGILPQHRVERLQCRYLLGCLSVLHREMLRMLRCKDSRGPDKMLCCCSCARLSLLVVPGLVQT